MIIYLVFFREWDMMDIVACYSTHKAASNLATRRNKKQAKGYGEKYTKGYGPYYVEEFDVKGA